MDSTQIATATLHARRKTDIEPTGQGVNRGGIENFILFSVCHSYMKYYLNDKTRNKTLFHCHPRKDGSNKQNNKQK